MFNPFISNVVKIRRNKAHILFLLLYVFGSSLMGQNMHLSMYTEENGLPSNQVRHVARDTFGFWWVATDNGLVRFDGTTFEDYAQYVPSRYGKHFCTTGEGLLLSHDAGISLIQPGLDSVHISLFQAGSIAPDTNTFYYPDRLFTQRNGTIWIGQPNGRIYNISNGKKKGVYTVKSVRKGEAAKAFFGETTHGVLWMATSEGTVLQFNEQDASVSHMATLPKVNDLKVAGNALWIAGDDIHRFQLSEDGTQILSKEVFFSDLGEVTSLALDAKGTLFAGIRNKGLFYLDRPSGSDAKFIRVFANNDPHSLEALPFQNIHTMILDSDDKLWVCSAEGLGILKRRFFESIASLPNANATAISIAENGHIFVNFGEIYAVESTGFGYAATRLSTTGLGTVTALTTAKDRLWTGSSTGSLFELTQEGRQLRSVDLSKRGEGIFHLEYDSKNRLWICQAPRDKPIIGVGCMLPDGAFREYGLNEGLKNRLICIRETAKGRIYASGIGASTYLYRYLPERDAFVNLSLPLDFYVSPNFQVHDFTIDNQGIIWLASTNGLLRYDMDRVRKVDLGPEFAEIEVKAVAHLDDGSIWISSDTEGVLRYKDGIAIVMKEESGLPSQVMTYRCLIADQQSQIWIGTTEGIVYSLDAHPTLQKSIRPWLISRTIDGEKLLEETCTLLPNQLLTLTFNAPAFHGFRTLYQHQIGEGPWSPPSFSRSLSLENMKPDNYTITIRSRQEGGYTWSDAISTRFAVQDYWYKRPLVQGMLGVLFLLLVVWFFRTQRQKLKQVTYNLKRLVKAEKEEINKQEESLPRIQETLQEKDREHTENLFILEILHRLIVRIPPRPKWEMVLETISLDLLKIPGVVAFEIGIRKGQTLEIERYTKQTGTFTSIRESFDPKSSLAAYCIAQSKAHLFHDLPHERTSRLITSEKIRNDYQAAIYIPFFLDNKHAVLSVYADKKGAFDEFILKAMHIFTTTSNKPYKRMNLWKIICLLSFFLMMGYCYAYDTLKVGVAIEPPFVIKDGQEYSGLSIDLWKDIAASHGVAYEIREFNDHLGLIRALDFEDIDITVNPIHVNEVRITLLEATQPFYVSKIGVATTQAERSQIGLFLRNFFSLQFFRLLFFLAMTIFIFGTVLWLVERKHNQRQFRPTLIGLFDGFWWSAVTMTTVGYGDKAPKTKMGRVIAMVWMFTAIVLISGFTATIASTLTVSSLSRNIEDLEDLRNTAYIGSVFGSSSEDFLKRNQIRPATLYKDAEQSLLALSAGEIEVLVYDKTILDYLMGKMQLGNKVSLLPVYFNKQYRSFFLPKGSKHPAWINPLLVRKINDPSWQLLLHQYNLKEE